MKGKHIKHQKAPAAELHMKCHWSQNQKLTRTRCLGSDWIQATPAAAAAAAAAAANACPAAVPRTAKLPGVHMAEQQLLPTVKAILDLKSDTNLGALYS
jgi:hypothetical protein